MAKAIAFIVFLTGLFLVQGTIWAQSEYQLVVKGSIDMGNTVYHQVTPQLSTIPVGPGGGGGSVSGKGDSYFPGAAIVLNGTPQIIPQTPINKGYEIRFFYKCVQDIPNCWKVFTNATEKYLECRGVSVVLKPGEKSENWSVRGPTSGNYKMGW